MNIYGSPKISFFLFYFFAKNKGPCLNGTYLHNCLVNSSGTPSHTDTQILRPHCYNGSKVLYCSHQCPSHIHPHLSGTGYQSRLLGIYRYQWSGHMTDQDQSYEQQHNYMYQYSYNHKYCLGKLKNNIIKFNFTLSLLGVTFVIC